MKAPDTVIELEDVEKTYRVYHQQGRGWILSWLMPFLPKERFYNDNTALRNIDLRVNRGEVLGIFGRNGSGKSTLLRIVSGLSLPTRGNVRVHGRVRSLLSLGVGFHPRFTGRENILFGSMAMGIPRPVALERLDSIIEFSELGDHIDKPIQFYSSGMTARLAASVAFQEAAEILVIDEALAAGDANFTTKCTQRIEEICSSGSTVLFVSHTIALVERLCTRAILLDTGELLADGGPSEVAGEYRKVLVAQQTQRLEELSKAAQPPDPAVPEYEQPDRDDIEFLGATMYGADGAPRQVFDHGEPLEVRVRVRARRTFPKVRFYFELYSDDLGVKLTEIGSNYQSAKTEAFAEYYPEVPEGETELTLRFPKNPLGSGTYYWNILFARPAEEVKVESELFYHFYERRVCPFRSTSFPGVEWAQWRVALAEPSTEFLLRALPETEAHEDDQPAEAALEETLR